MTRDGVISLYCEGNLPSMVHKGQIFGIQSAPDLEGSMLVLRNCTRGNMESGLKWLLLLIHQTVLNPWKKPNSPLQTRQGMW